MVLYVDNENLGSCVYCCVGQIPSYFGQRAVEGLKNGSCGLSGRHYKNTISDSGDVELPVCLTFHSDDEISPCAVFQWKQRHVVVNDDRVDTLIPPRQLGEMQ